MCLSIPCEVLEVNDGYARVSLGGAEYNAGLHLVPDVSKGDFVLVHAGFVIEKIDSDEAQKTLDIFKQMEG